MMVKKLKCCQKGAGLIEILIASGVLLFIVQYVMQSLLNFKDFQKYENLQLSNFFLKNYVNELVDCENTMDKVESCKTGDEISLYDSEDEIFVPIPASSKKMFRRYKVRAICSACEDCPGGKTIDVESLALKDGKPDNHPHRSKPVLISLYLKIAFKCPFPGP